MFEKSRFCHISPTMFPHSSFQTAGANPGPRTVSLDLPGLFKHPLNKGEARNALARAIFFYRLGEIRDRSFESQVYRASGLNLLIAAIILWNTRYLEQAFVQLQRQGVKVAPTIVAHVAPLGWEYIG